MFRIAITRQLNEKALLTVVFSNFHAFLARAVPFLLYSLLKYEFFFKCHFYQNWQMYGMFHSLHICDMAVKVATCI